MQDAGGRGGRVLVVEVCGEAEGREPEERTTPTVPTLTLVRREYQVRKESFCGGVQGNKILFC